MNYEFSLEISPALSSLNSVEPVRRHHFESPLSTENGSIERTLTSHGRKALSSMSGIHWDRSQSMSLSAPMLRHGSRHSSTTTESDLACIPQKKGSEGKDGCTQWWPTPA